MADRNDFSTIAYSKMIAEYDRDLFIQEYDDYILPNGKPITNGKIAVPLTKDLNRAWGMMSDEDYDSGDVWVQPGDARTMELDSSTPPDSFLQKFAQTGGTSFRNETLGSEYKFVIRPQYKHMKMWQWIQDTLPFQKINGLHCVSIEPGGFSLIHRDQKGLYDNQSSAGVNRLYAMGFVVIVINISNGGVPMYWSLDGADAKKPFKADDPIYMSNDYFLHGVPIVSSRRRQVRVIGVPKPEMWDLMDHNTTIDVGPDYKFKPGFVFD
jgi:hypothetical protein